MVYLNGEKPSRCMIKFGARRVHSKVVYLSICFHGSTFAMCKLLSYSEHMLNRDI